MYLLHSRLCDAFAGSDLLKLTWVLDLDGRASVDADEESQDSLDDAEALATQQEQIADDFEEMETLIAFQKKHEGGNILQVRSSFHHSCFQMSWHRNAKPQCTRLQGVSCVHTPSWERTKELFSIILLFLICR